MAEHLHDMRQAQERIARATAQATCNWADLYGADVLLDSVPGWDRRPYLPCGPSARRRIRFHHCQGSRLLSYVGMNPSTWSSGTVVQPSRGDHQGRPRSAAPGVLQAVGAARQTDPSWPRSTGT